MSLTLLGLLIITDIFFIATYVTEPGIIPGRMWGASLPAKYKSADVILSLIKFVNRIKIRGYSTGQCQDKGRLCIR